MHARMSTVEGDPSKIDDAVAVMNDKIIPALKGMKGFTALNLLADRSTGKLVAVAFWEDEAALEASAEAIGPLRNEVADVVGGKVVSVESYDLVAQSW